MSSNIIGAIEIGTAKVVAVVGEVLRDASLNIIGIGEGPTAGIKKGEVVDLKSATASVHSVLMAAEKSANTPFQGIYLAQTGGHLEGFLNEASVNVSSSDNIVSDEDLDRVILDAKGKQIPQDRVYIHHIQNPSKLDGRVVSSPVGMEGRKLEIAYWSVHGELAKVRDMIHIVNGYSLRVEDVILSSIASGSMVTDETEKVNGVLVLDIGRGTTDYAVYKGGFITHTGVIPVGGDHITNDISLGLRIDRNQAERLKNEFSSALINNIEGKGILIESEGNLGKRSVNSNAIDQITNIRLTELFTIIKEIVSNMMNVKDLHSGVVITGGSSHLKDIHKLAAQIFQLPSRLGENPAWACEALRDPEYSTVLGVMYYALKKKESTGMFHSKREGLFSKVAKIFTSL